MTRRADVWSQEVPASWVVPDPAAKVEEDLVRDVLFDLVGRLPERLCQVIVGRYGLGEQRPCMLKKLGKELGITGERVRQLQQEALAWLRHPAHSWRLRQLVGKNRALRHCTGFDGLEQSEDDFPSESGLCYFEGQLTPELQQEINALQLDVTSTFQCSRRLPLRSRMP